MTETNTDIICPFIIDSGLSRGQAVRLGASLDKIISQHNYPERIGNLVAQAAVLASLLSSTIKFDGVFTLQAQGDGPISLLAVDITTDGCLRGYAKYDEERLFTLGEKASISALFGKGTLSFNVERLSQNYQGIIPLEETTLTECVLAYFRQSEQIDTAINLAVKPADESGQGWQAAAIMIQKMPVDDKLLENLNDADIDDLWQTSLAMLHSATTTELFDCELSLEKLLYRLYHLNDLHFFTTKGIKFSCRCSKEKVIQMLSRFPEQDIKEMIVDGKISVDCQFCGNNYTLTLKDLDKGKQ